jgi:hypothetical protein
MLIFTTIPRVPYLPTINTIVQSSLFFFSLNYFFYTLLFSLTISSLIHSDTSHLPTLSHPGEHRVEDLRRLLVLSLLPRQPKDPGLPYSYPSLPFFPFTLQSIKVTFSEIRLVHPSSPSPIYQQPNNYAQLGSLLLQSRTD